eukprot:1069472_1
MYHLFVQVNALRAFTFIGHACQAFCVRFHAINLSSICYTSLSSISSRISPKRSVLVVVTDGFMSLVIWLYTFLISFIITWQNIDAMRVIAALVSMVSVCVKFH